jgi:hypothetical protein
MKQRTMIIISAMASAVGLYFLLKPNLKGLGFNRKSATNYKATNDNGFIITIPESSEKKWNLVYIFGGMAYATPKWMFDKTPKSILLNNVVIFAPYTSTFTSTQNKLKEIIEPKGIQVEKISMLGFSAGALNILSKFSNNIKFFGLIDPSNKVEYLNLNFGKNTYMVYNESNWGAYPRIKKDMLVMANNINGKGGFTESVKLSHEKIPNYFMNKFATEINKQ